MCRFAARADGSIVAFVPPSAQHGHCIVMFGPTEDTFSSGLSRSPATSGSNAGGPDLAPGTAPATSSHKGQQKWKRRKSIGKSAWPGCEAELSPDGLSLIDWVKTDARASNPNDFWAHETNQVGHMKIDQLKKLGCDPDAAEISKLGACHDASTCMPHNSVLVTWAPRMQGIPGGIYACSGRGDMCLVDGGTGKLLMHWSKPGREGVTPKDMQGLRQLSDLQKAEWSGVWWAPDHRALCCTVKCWALVVFFDDSAQR